MERIKVIEKAILTKMNGKDTCTIKFKGCGEKVLIHYQGNDPFYSKRGENWYMGQPEKLRNWVVTSTLTELAEWIDKYC